MAADLQVKPKKPPVSMRVRKPNVPIEKNAMVTARRVDAHREEYEEYCDLFTAYPDLFVDLITPKNSGIELYFYQRIFLRACMRYRYHYCVAPRAFSKSFVSILGMYLKCIFQPGIKVFICAPKKEQGAKIARDKIEEIWNFFPILQNEILSKNFSQDLIRLVFKNGSIFDVVYAGEKNLLKIA